MRDLRQRTTGTKLLGAVIAALLVASVSAAPTATASSAGLAAGGGPLDGLLGTASNVVAGLVGVVDHPGWDDHATTNPTPLADVTRAVGAQALWDRGIDGSGIDVATIDSGLAPVLGLDAENKVINGPDLSFDSQSADYRYLDTFGHGTHMAGIIAGNDGTASGFKGVAPGSRLVSLKVASHSGAVDVSQVIAAIDWVVQHRNDGMNIRVLNLAFGTNGLQDRSIDPLAHAVESAWRNGIVVVVAGGNDGSTHPSLTNPAFDPRVLAVGAVDLNGTISASDDRVAPFSSRGNATRYVDLVAPGVSIASLRNPGSTIDDEHPSAVVEDRFFRGSGTSQAAAVTAGAVALLLQARPELTPDQVKVLLRITATPLIKDTVYARGAGRLNVDLAARSPLTSLSEQGLSPSHGTGSLEAARGTDHVGDEGVELIGERDIMGTPWDGAEWAPLSAAGTAWSGGYWRSVEWTGSCWCTDSWSGKSWTGKSWTGKSWTGKSWTSEEWAGKSWTGKSWTGKSWTGKSWTGKSWTGSNWASARGRRP